MERRLAAIVAVDVVGYSRLMERDEETTLQRVRTLRKQVLMPLLDRHQGRIVKLMGDGVLLEFASAVNAVDCAVELQCRTEETHAALPPDERIVLRVGINLGDVMAEEGDLFGDGVNIAARLETTAPPGGIHISRTVHNHVRRKTEHLFEPMGAQQLKNISEPVEVFRWLPPNGTEAASIVSERPADGGATRSTLTALAQNRSLPSIAVLPFVNMSGDPGQEFFADGLAEDLLTALSRFKDLFVISRTSTFRYKGKSTTPKAVAAELGVQYVLEGSVRRAGDRVRVTAQLIDAESDSHVWAERYDREIHDIFQIQDDITAQIAAILHGRVEAAWRDRAARRPPSSLRAYECVLTGKLLHHRVNPDDNVRAQEVLERAIELEPGYAHAWAWRACAVGQSWVYGWCADKDETWSRVIESLEMALSLDDNDSDVHRILAAVGVAKNDHDSAWFHQERALALNPNDDLIVVQTGEILTWLGRPEEGIPWIERAMRLNPFHPERFWNHLGRAQFVAKRYREAIASFRRIGKPDHSHFAFIAGCHAMLGQAAEAAIAADEALRRSPDFTVAAYAETLHYRNQEDLAHHLEALKLAGLPD